MENLRRGGVCVISGEIVAERDFVSCNTTMHHSLADFVAVFSFGCCPAFLLHSLREIDGPLGAVWRGRHCCILYLWRYALSNARVLIGSVQGARTSSCMLRN